MSGVAVASPIAGWLLPLDAVPDPVFAERMLGDGVAIDPTDGIVRAPFAGRIVSLHPARHAVTLESEAGAVLLIHVGLETVGLEGEGFVAHKVEGERVAAGEPLLTVDLDAVGRRAKSLVTPLIVTNGDRFALAPVRTDRLVKAGEPLLVLTPVAAVETGGTVAAGEAEAALRLPLAHGLHARPAARVAALARGFDAEAELVSEDGRHASAASPVAMLALALRHDALVQVRARGREADRAVAEIAALLASGMGDGQPTTAPQLDNEPAKEAPPPAFLSGVTAAPGEAIGPAFLLTDGIDAGPRDGGGVAIEQARLARALGEVRDQLASAARRPDAAGTIADAHLAFLTDPELVTAAERAIAEGRAAGFAWARAIERFVALLSAAGDDRFRERVDDLRDLEAQVLTALSGGAAATPVPAGAVLVADTLLPSQLVRLADAGLAGIATAGGGPTSHVAIIAAGLGLPMVAALGPDLLRIAPGTSLLLDAGAGALTVDPPPHLLAERAAATRRRAAFREAALARAHEPAVTRDGTRIEVFANLGSLAEATVAAANGAEGCGLLRTEFLFLDRPRAPDEAEQQAAYQVIADALGGRPLIVRTLDIGADKPAPYLPMPAEENPALGLRGIRLALAQPKLLDAQLGALVRVEGDVRIMLPMVAEVDEVARVRTVLARAAERAGRPVPSLGIMVETPAAALLAPALARHADFFSIGSNDLTQYALAADRGNPAVAARLDPLHPAVLRLIALTTDAALGAGRWTGVCGGMAADGDAVPLLLGLGVTELSVPAAAVAETKARVRGWDLEACRTLAARALAAEDGRAVRQLVADEAGGEVA